jgi:hypothetical protein
MLASVEKNTYAVTLNNVDKFELLTQVSATKKAKRGQDSGIVPSEEYLSNLRLSFNFAQIP